MPDRSHFIIIIINKQGQMKARMQILIMQVENEFKDTSNHRVLIQQAFKESTQSSELMKNYRKTIKIVYKYKMDTLQS